MRKFEFSFKSCLFVLNRCDETEIDIEVCKKEYEKIFEINKREQKWDDIIAKAQILKDVDNINITKFSNELYSKFKDLKNRVNDYSKFIKYYESNIDKKLNNKTYLLTLRKKIYSIVCSISSEMYNNYKILDNIDKYKIYFQEYMNEYENIEIIEEIIKMYLFIKDYIYKSKFYIESNAKDFFLKFKKELISSKVFYDESLKRLAIKYLINLYQNFEFMQIRILEESIDVKFTKEEFIQTKKKIELKYENEKEEIKKNIDSTILSMKNEYDSCINDLKNGNYKSCDDLLTKAYNNINKYKIDLEKKINEEIPKYREKLLKELNFIVKKLNKKPSKIYEGNFSSNGMFTSIYKAEEIAQNVFLYGVNILCVIEYSLLGISTLTLTAAEGVGVAVAQVGGAFLSFGSLIGAGIGFALGIAIPYTIQGAFYLYKKLVEKNKYIELVQNAKKELEHSLKQYEEKMYEILNKIKEENQIAVEKFFKLQNVKLNGIKEHMQEWLLLKEEIKNEIEQ